MVESVMSRFVPVIKSLLIWGMVALSMYLFYQLWFVNFTSRSFVPYMTARFASNVPDDVSELVRPSRIISGAGDGYFDIMYSNVSGSDIWEYGESVITAVLQNGGFVQTHEADISHLLDLPVIIYEYAFDMNAIIFAQAFGQRTGAVLTDREINRFHAVAVHPPYDGNNAIGVFFIGCDYVWEFALVPDGRRVRESDFDFPILSAAGLRRHFVALDDGLGFAMRLHRNFTYNPILAVNPYENRSGLLDLAFIRDQIEHFFNNPATINHGVSVGQIYTFSNLRTVVRYQPWHVVEYSSFRTIGRTSSTSFVSDFSAAFAFVRDNPNVTNEFFLAGYEPRGRETVFWFDYVIDNFPLVLQPWYTGPDCNSPLLHPIEVVVEHGRVIRFRKIAYTFAVDTAVTARPDSLLLQENSLGFSVERSELHRDHIRLRVINNERWLSGSD